MTVKSELHHSCRWVLADQGADLRQPQGEYGLVTDEHALLKRARAYDQQALGELYDKYAPRIYAYLYHRVSDAQVAQDLTSEVFVRMLQAIRSEQTWHTSFKAWLYRIAHNLAIDHYRRRGRSEMVPLGEHLPSDEDEPASLLSQQASQERLRDAIRRLTPDQQHVLALRFGEQLTSREVAQILDKSVGAVEALQHRALAALRRILE